MVAPPPSLRPGFAWAAVLIWVSGCAWDGLTGPAAEFEDAKIHAGNNFACALGTDRRIRCWGANGSGQLGDSSFTHRIVPVMVSGNLHFAGLGIHGTGNHACAVTVDQDAYCWGDNAFGQLGDGTTDLRVSPVPVSGGIKFQSVSAGWRVSCGVSVDGQGYCWGRGVWGQLGDGRAEQSSVPVLVSGDIQFAAIEAGTNNLVCGVTLDRTLYCWGLNWNRSIGSATTDSCGNSTVLECATTPVAVDIDGAVRDLAVGMSYACAVTNDGRLFCWGSDEWGQLGRQATDSCPSPISTGSTPCVAQPMEVPGLPPVASVSAGNQHACAVTEDGQGFCWGRNQFGELGDGTVFTQNTTPTPVSGGLVFTSISAGALHSCGATREGPLYCWGVNDLGQIGDGTANLALVPSRVRGGGGPSLLRRQRSAPVATGASRVPVIAN